MAVVGISTSSTCGVRDYAGRLAEALGEEGVSCSMHWLDRRAQGLGATRAEIHAWARALAAELDGLEPDAILLHYSVFTFAYRGVPLFVHPTLAALRRGAPVLTVMHEFAYPWGRGGLRGTAWAVSQRALLIEVMRASAAALVTIDGRAAWLDSRVWLPRRPAAFAPVFSNLPPPSAGSRPERREACVGLFGYSHEGSAMALVLDGLRLLHDRGRDVRLRLLGAPGRDSQAGDAWCEGARTRGIATAPSFSGMLTEQELSDALAACEVLLFADAAGPSSRKTTLAASLASGTAVLAIDGPLRWSELTEAQAVALVAPSAGAVADGLDALLADEPRRRALAERGRAFAEQQMSVGRCARTVRDLLDRALAP
jgi:glycosyltransferase involved in cell wall biosynthesis